MDFVMFADGMSVIIVIQSATNAMLLFVACAKMLMTWERTIVSAWIADSMTMFPTQAKKKVRNTLACAIRYN